VPEAALPANASSSAELDLFQNVKVVETGFGVAAAPEAEPPAASQATPAAKRGAGLVNALWIGPSSGPGRTFV
jgi:hypothetical protein